MEKIKSKLRPIYLPIISYVMTYINMVVNFYIDYKLYNKYSIVFRKNNFLNKEAALILDYHSIEKGMLFKEMKCGFAPYRIKKLHKALQDPEIIENVSRSQVKVAYQIMCKYYELHKNKNYEIEDIFSKEQYEKYKSILNNNYSSSFEGILNWTKEKFYKHNSEDFFHFAKSRKSVREFTGNIISHKILENVVELANTAPSVCNRQASNVYLLEDKILIDNVLKIQGGFNGYTENVNQLLIVTNDRKFYYTVGERNQLYIDGGVYLMNLLYSLHFYRVGNCPANWGKTTKDEQKLKNFITIPESQKIICMIPIGEIKNSFRTTLSKRRPAKENFKLL